MFMKIQEADILKKLVSEPFDNQRILAETTGYSLGMVNKSLKALQSEGYIDNRFQLTAEAKNEMEKKKPKNAVILAAGFGMRMVPINLSTSKAFLEVNGERLIERLIRQLHDAGVTDITVVVGFMKDSFEYLIDEFGVELVVNGQYALRNNLHSLALVKEKINNTYIIPCDIWCRSNPFNKTELYSWYMVSEQMNKESSVYVNRKKELVSVSEKEDGNVMIGISYIVEPEANYVRSKLAEYDDDRHAGDFWETCLYKKDRLITSARVVNSSEVIEINTYEQLRELDSDSSQLKSDAIETIASVLKCKETEITNISILKKGMTNRSFLFDVFGSKYIMRIPGEGTDRLINRKQEADVFKTISGFGLCDDPVYINSDNGYKITRYLNNVRVCDPHNVNDLEKCMAKLRYFHGLHLAVPHSFDIFGQIQFYEELWDGNPSIYKDYVKTKENIFSLRKFVENLDKEWCLTHIDAVPDNFLFYQTDSEEKLQLTDWEYAGMQDPHVDIAMFCIYSLYNKKQCDQLIDIYFENKCDQMVRAKIYAYIAMCGLLWSNWCEFKSKLGVEFGEYSLRQYRYAKDFYRYAMELIGDHHDE